MIPDLTAGGLLPLGRHHATLNDVEEAFVAHEAFSQSVSRPGIWEEFARSLEALRTLVPPCAAWIGGSFTTAKTNPSDIDVTWIVPRDAANALRGDDQAARRLTLFAGEKRLIGKGIRVDSFLAGWAPYAEPTLGDVGYRDMAATLGYWNDWWQRLRPEGVVSHPSSSVPRRGYLEVTLDGYPS